MSPISLKTPADTPQTWFLRKEDDSVYGPVTLPRMIDWAKTGRIAPGDRISPDRERWGPASELAELNLCWMLDAGDGTEYGPVHIDVCRELAREGQIESGTVLRNIRTGTRQVLDETPQPARPAPAAAAGSEDPVAAGPGPEAPAPQPEAEAPSQEAEPPPAWSILARERDFLVGEARRWKTLYESERESAAAAEADSTERIRELEQEIIRLQTAQEKSAMDVCELESVLDRHGTEAGLDAGSLGRAHYELSRRFLDLSERYEDKLADANSMTEELDRLRRETAEQEERSRALLLRERAVANEARRKQAALEKSYAEAVRSLREINDRFIRSRAGTSTPPVPARPQANRTPVAPAKPARAPEKKTGSAEQQPARPAPSKGPRIQLTR